LSFEIRLCIYGYDDYEIFRITMRVPWPGSFPPVFVHCGWDVGQKILPEHPLYWPAKESVDDLADYLDTFMKRARREAQPKDAKTEKDEAASVGGLWIPALLFNTVHSDNVELGKALPDLSDGFVFR
jgi:hypothetical protein